jgi:hypothetical protein
VTAASGAGSVTLAEASFTDGDGKAHRLLVTGGFNGVCNPCSDRISPAYGVTINGGSPVFTRWLPALLSSATNRTGAVLSEIIVTPSVCGPCTLALLLNVPATSGATMGLSASDVRLGLVDLGPVST